MTNQSDQSPSKEFIPNIDYKKNPVYQDIKNKKKIPLFLYFEFSKAYFSISKAFLKGKFLALTTKQIFSISSRSKELDSQGICLVTLPRYAIDNINTVYKSEIKELREKRETYSPEKRGIVNSIKMLCSDNDKGINYVYFNDLAKEYGILEAIEAHKKMPMQLRFVALQINDSTDKGVEKSCRDRYGNLSLTKYMHIDSGVDTMKFLLYLNVGIKKGKGSFSFVKASHKNHSFNKLVSRKVNDVINLESGKKESAIHKFVLLPKIFQHKANFGNDLNIDQHKEIIDDLLTNEMFVESATSSGCIFNPDGIHRGGFFDQKGERIMLQFMYTPCFNILKNNDI